jgi:putative endonuclease
MYILLCSNGKYYVGSTKYLMIRVRVHQKGKGAKYCKKHRPVELVYYEVFNRVDDAFHREKKIKNWSHNKKKALIEGDLKQLTMLGKKKF